MSSITLAIFYILTFISVYVQIFFLLTFFEKKKNILIRKENFELDEYQSVTIVVPCYNEEGTIKGTIDSLLDLDYPKEKLKLIIVDDGSKDNTWNVIKEYENFPNIKQWLRLLWCIVPKIFYKVLKKQSTIWQFIIKRCLHF